MLDTLAATLPGYASSPFEVDADYKIARGIIEKIGVGKIVERRLNHRRFDYIGRDRQ